MWTLVELMVQDEPCPHTPAFTCQSVTSLLAVCIVIMSHSRCIQAHFLAIHLGLGQSQATRCQYLGLGWPGKCDFLALLSELDHFGNDLTCREGRLLHITQLFTFVSLRSHHEVFFFFFFFFFKIQLPDGAQSQACQSPLVSRCL